MIPSCGETSMAQFYFSVNLEEGRTLFLAPLSDRVLSSLPEEVPDPSGYFLFERRGSGDAAEVEIIARVSSDEAALKLSGMMGMR